MNFEFQYCTVYSTVFIFQNREFYPIRRKVAEEVEKEVQTKRIKTQTSMEELDEAYSAYEEKFAEFDSKKTLWDKILALVTAPDRPPKEAGMPWCDYFQILVSQDVPECPVVFQTNDLEYSAMVMKLSTHILFLHKEFRKASNGMQRCQTKVKKKRQHSENRETRLNAKVNRILEEGGGDPKSEVLMEPHQ